MFTVRPTVFYEAHENRVPDPLNVIRGGRMQETSARHRYRLFHCDTLLWLVLLPFFLGGVCSARPRKDVIQFVNGDRITCEIIKLEKGYLYVKLEYADGTVAMDWSRIARIESPQSFVVADKDGERYTGSLRSEAAGKAPEELAELKVHVMGASGSQVVPAKEVVTIERTDTSFWQNLHGGLDAGFNYSKQQSRTQYNFDSNTIFQ